MFRLRGGRAVVLENFGGFFRGELRIVLARNRHLIQLGRLDFRFGSFVVLVGHVATSLIWNDDL
jgi:hypothetical protein